MLIIDAHLDLALNALQLNRDLLVSAHTIRTHELGTPGKGRAKATTALPDMRRGRVALSIVTAVAKASGHPIPHLDFRSATQTYAIATLIVLISAAVSALIVRRRIDHLDMVEVLKTKE